MHHSWQYISFRVLLGYFPSVKNLFQKPTTNLLKEIWLVLSKLHVISLQYSINGNNIKDNRIKNSVTVHKTSYYKRLIPVCFCSNLFCTTPVCLCNQSKELLPRKPINPRPLLCEKCRYLTQKIPYKITRNSNPEWTYLWHF